MRLDLLSTEVHSGTLRPDPKNMHAICTLLSVFALSFQPPMLFT